MCTVNENVLFGNQLRKETKEDQLTQIHLENGGVCIVALLTLG